MPAVTFDGVSFGSRVMAKSPTVPSPAPRLRSLDAYRGFVMLAMASGGLGLAGIVRNNPDIVARFNGTQWERPWTWLWQNLAFHTDHVAWHGCSFWDLIQPSFMFMVGVALPFSLARREKEGYSEAALFGLALLRSFILVALGVLLASNWSSQTNFLFTNVLAQIGLGYSFLYLLADRKTWLHLVVAAAVLGGYGAWFAFISAPPHEEQLVRDYVEFMRESHGKFKRGSEFDQFTGLAAKWNKHLNAAGMLDRRLLNSFPRDKEKEPLWNGQPRPAPETAANAAASTAAVPPQTGWKGWQFWVNDGGYQTTNFVPSFVTMLFGLMTGRLLRSERSDRARLLWMVGGGLLCFVIALGLDTKLWPVQVAGYDWCFCPAVKRIWTPTWTLYSTGWTLWMLSAFYLVIDVFQWRAWSFPLVVVGMNSIAIYLGSQLLGGWIKETAKIHFAAFDAAFGSTVVPFFFDSRWSEFRTRLLVVTVLWLMCLWLYRQKVFFKV